MKTHPHIALGIGSRPWTTYGVKDGRAYVKSALPWGPQSTIEIANAGIELRDRSLLGHGTIVIKANSAEQVWHGVPSAKDVHRRLERLAQGLAETEEDQARQNTTNNRTRPVPDGILLSERVLEVPPIPEYLEAAFFYASGPSQGGIRNLKDCNAWLQVGDPLHEFWFGGAYANPKQLVTCSPVRGQVLCPYAQGTSPFLVRLEEGSDGPGLADAFYGELCDFVSQHRQRMLKAWGGVWQSKLSDRPESIWLDDQRFRVALDAFRNTPTRVKSMSEIT